MTEPRYVIIVAGGRGTRMGADRPKQFLPLHGSPILAHTIHRFHQYDPHMGVVVVLPRRHLDEWKKWCAEANFPVKHELAVGGDERFHSVKNGLALVRGPGVVAVHDGVRPLVSEETMDRCYHLAAEKGAAVPVMPVVDSLRQRTEEGSTAVDRGAFVRVQTPQCFVIDLLKEAYQQPFSPSFTDDASVVEAMGAKVHVCEGNPENLKITNMVDLKVAEMLMGAKP